MSQAPKSCYGYDNATYNHQKMRVYFRVNCAEYLRCFLEFHALSLHINSVSAAK